MVDFVDPFEASTSKGFKDPFVEPTMASDEPSPLRGKSRAVGEAAQIGDMILGFPAFLAKLGVTGVMDIAATAAGAKDPMTMGKKVANDFLDFDAFHAASQPIQTALRAAGMQDTTTGTAVGKATEGLSNIIETAAKYWEDKTGSPDIGELIRQSSDVVMAKGGEVLGKAAKEGVTALKGDKAPVNSVDAILKDIEMAEPTASPKEFVDPVTTPESKLIVGDEATAKLDDSVAEAKQAEYDAQPVKDFVEPTTTVEPLGGVGKKGFGQGGAINFFGKEKPKTIEEQAKILNVEDWGKQFTEAYPQYADKPEIIQKVYDRLNPTETLKTSFKEAFENSNLVQSLDKGLGAVSTRIGNISEPILHRGIRYEKDLLQKTHEKILRADDFLVDLNKLPENVKKIADNLILNNKSEHLNRVFDSIGRPELKEKYQGVRTLLDEVGGDLQSVGRLENLRKDYFPRIVTDLKGLKEHMGTEQSSALELRLKEAQKKNGNIPLDEVAQSEIVNQFLRSNTRNGFKPGFTKERVLDEVTPDLEKFYASPTEGLHTYLRNATSEIETAKFFGKDAVKDKTTGRINVDESVGNLVADKLNKGEITGKQADELESILKSRLGPGNRTSNVLLQDIKNIANMGLLGNAVSAIAQGGDVISSAYLNGLRPTLMAVVKQAKGNAPVSMKDFGLVDHISEEFVNQRSTSKVLNKIFKLSGFSAIDHLGKNTVLNSTLIKAMDKVKSAEGRASLERQWGKRFGDEFPQLVRDLREGKRTELTDMLAFSSLSKIQPITKLELPQKYLDMPNGRVIYMLKSFMLKQMDLIRNDSYNQIKKGNVKEGLGNLMRYSLVLGLGGATTNYVKDFLLYGADAVDPKLSDIPLNVLKTFGLGEYVQDEIKQGKLGEALGGMALPPYKMFDQLFQDSIKELTGDEDHPPSGKAWNNFPVVGKFIYTWLMGGREKELDKREKAQDAE